MGGVSVSGLFDLNKLCGARRAQSEEHPGSRDKPKVNSPALAP